MSRILEKDYENNYLAALREITTTVNSYTKRTSLAFEIFVTILWKKENHIVTHLKRRFQI